MMLYVSDIKKFDKNIVIYFAGCNFRCEDCRRKLHWRRKGHNVQSFKVGSLIEKILEITKDYNYEIGKVGGVNEINKIVLSGGEPFIQQQEELYDLSERLIELGYEVYIITNGTVYVKYIYDDVKILVIPKVMKSNFEKFVMSDFSILYPFNCHNVMHSIEDIKNYFKKYGIVYVYGVNGWQSKFDIDECVNFVIENDLKDMARRFDISGI